MTNFIIDLAKRTVELTLKKWFKRYILIGLIILITSLIAVNYYDKKSIINDYKVINYNDISKYKAYSVNNKIFTQPKYLPNINKKGIAIVFNDDVHSEFLEMHLVGNCKYKLIFLNKMKIVHNLLVTVPKEGLLVKDIGKDIVYDCILIQNIVGKMPGIEYINPIEKIEDNIVLKKIEDSTVINSFEKKENSINLPYNVTGIQAFNNGFNNGKYYIEIKNIHTMDIKLLNIIDDQGKIISIFPSNDNIIKSLDTGKIFSFTDVDIEDVSIEKNLYINYIIGEGENINRAEVIKFSRFNIELFENTQIRTKDNMADFDFINVKGNHISFKTKKVTIDKPLFIPSGYSFELDQGQTVDIVNDSYIICRSKVNFKGSEQNPIKFISSDKSGMGIFVCQAEEESEIEYCLFDGLNTPISGMWQLTGAVTFYESDVIMKSCEFSNNTCEDALNIVRSSFIVDDCLFKNIFGDAFDSDFCEGDFLNSKFINTGNDGFDVSTSNIVLRNIEFKSIGDKAISGGEKSNLNLQDINIYNTVIGIASKDSSSLIGGNVMINNAEIALALYQKKPEYNGGYLSINDLELVGDIGIDYLIQEHSKLFLDDKEVLPRSLSKEGILFDKMINGQSITINEGY